jgi:hypothetical protein
MPTQSASFGNGKRTGVPFGWLERLLMCGIGDLDSPARTDPRERLFTARGPGVPAMKVAH